MKANPKIVKVQSTGVKQHCHHPFLKLERGTDNKICVSCGCAIYTIVNHNKNKFDKSFQ